MKDKRRMPAGLAPRSAALKSLLHWKNNLGFVQDGLRLYCGELDSQDRALAYKIALGACRMRLRLDALISLLVKKMPKEPLLSLIEISLYQAFFMRIPDYAAANLAVSLARFLGLGGFAEKFTNAVIRNALRNGLPDLPADFVQRISLQYGVAPWLVLHFLKKENPQNLEERLELSTKPQAWWIRANPLKTNAAALVSELKLQNPKILFDRFIEIQNVSALLNHSLFAEGHFSFQNPASYLVTQKLDVEPHCKVWDACAAPGGKSALIAEDNPDAFIFATDNSESRIKQIEDLQARLGIKNVNILLADAENPPFEEPFDRILLDVPCSNLGVFARRPEVLQRITDIEFAELPKRQLKLLSGAAKFLRKGGILVYATCSPEKSETEDVVNEFLRNNAGFKIEETKEQAEKEGFDSFFSAKIIREF